MRPIVVALVVFHLSASSAACQPPPDEEVMRIHQSYGDAYELERRGQERAAFFQYLQAAGGEHAAIRLARPQARDYLESLREKKGAVPLARFLLIEGDLLLALGKKDEALARYRAAAAGVPRGAYFVEPPALSPRDDFHAYHAAVYRPQWPFGLGPGSHRDNWLLRRFLALEAWDDAAREYVRIWTHHREEADKKGAGEIDEPQEFSSLALLFALDYSFFHKQRKAPEKAHTILEVPLLQLKFEKQETHPAFIMHWPSKRAFGISSKEYLRLVHGEFKAAGKEARLVGLLEKEITDGKNEPRRALARIRLHQGRPDDALKLELDYLQAAKLEGAVRAFRRGETFEEFQKPAQAIAEFEKVVALLPKKRDDKANEQERMREGVMSRLDTLYAGQGQTDKVLEFSLTQFDWGRFPSKNALEQAAERFSKAGQAAKFAAWLTEHAAQAKDPDERLHLNWARKDYPAALKAIAELIRGPQKSSWPIFYWQEDFRGVGLEIEFLRASTAAQPNDLLSRWQLLVLEDRLHTPEAMDVMEGILELEFKGQDVIRRAWKSKSRRDFDTVSPFVYRLLRLYQQHGHADKIVRVGRKVLAGEHPFGRIDRHTFWREDDSVHHPGNLVDCMLIVLLHLKEKADLEAFAALAERSGRFVWQNQLARRLEGAKAPRKDPFTGHVASHGKVTLRTVGVPASVKLLTTRDDVHAVLAGGEWVGTSWGLVRYREPEKGTLEILQVPLSAAVSDILATPAGLFAATDTGLFRVDKADTDTPEPVFVPVLQTAFTRIDKGHSYPCYLEWWNGRLWLDYGSTIVEYDPKTQQVVNHGDVYPVSGGGRPRWLVKAGGKLWGAGAVYSNTTGTFEPLHHPDPDRFGDVHVLGERGGTLWAKIATPKNGGRPAIVDPVARTLKVLPVANARAQQEYNFDALLGADERHVWFGPHEVLEYDRKTGALVHVPPPQGEEKRPHKGPAFWRAGRGPQRVYVGSATIEHVPGLTAYWLTGWHESPERILFGVPKLERSRDDGGLFALDPKSLDWKKLGAAKDDLGSLRVNKIVFDDDKNAAYVCTNDGVTILSLPDHAVVGRLTISDGLPSNRVVSLVRVGEMLCIACAPFYTDGGLALVDLKTGAIERVLKVDGLPSHHVKELRAEGNLLHVLYDTFNPVSSWDHHHGERMGAVVISKEAITFPSSIVDLKTKKVTAGKEILKPARALASETPYLGGPLTVDVTRQGTRYLGGARGLVIVAAKADLAVAAFPQQPVQRRLTRMQAWEAEAAKTTVEVKTPDDLAGYLDSPNPVIRAQALERLHQDHGAAYTKALAKAEADPDVKVRRLVLLHLQRLAAPGLAPVFERRLLDTDRLVRVNTAIGLAKSGRLPDLKVFEEALKLSEFQGWHHTRRSELFAALAPWAGSPKVLEFFVNHHGAWDDKEHPQQHAATLADIVRRHKGHVDLLLQAYDDLPSDVRPEVSKVAFAEQILRLAGKPILPHLFEALRSPERVVRSNAARACGAIGAREAIPHLRKALDLESGLARASIVVALGQLKAEEALPDLIKLYAEAANDEWAWGPRSSGGGFRSSQMAVVQTALFDHLSDLDELKGEWQDLKSVGRPLPRDPRRGEDLLKPDHLLAAIRNIGPEKSPEFYRVLAAARKHELRLEAAIHLRFAGPKQQEVSILRNLQADAARDVQMAATVSLYLLKQPGAQKTLEEWLASKNEWVRRDIVAALERVEDGRLLTFARAALTRIADDPEAHEYLQVKARQLLSKIS